MARTRAEAMRERETRRAEGHPVHAEQYGEERARAVAEGRDPNAEGIAMMSRTAADDLPLGDGNSSSHLAPGAVAESVTIEVEVPERLYSPVKYTGFRTAAIKATVTLVGKSDVEIGRAARRLREVLEAEARASFETALEDYLREMRRSLEAVDEKR